MAGQWARFCHLKGNSPQAATILGFLFKLLPRLEAAPSGRESRFEKIVSQ
jgi:hypothetical protein